MTSVPLKKLKELDEGSETILMSKTAEEKTKQQKLRLLDGWLNKNQFQVLIFKVINSKREFFLK